jgi:DNA-binding winged helix-turn-helix (wHTH) protein/Tol biopolymer transport system component
MTYERKPSFAFGPFVLDVAEQRLSRDGRAVPLAPRLFDVLLLLVENHGHLVDKETFIAKVWGGGFVEEGALTRSVSTVRKTLGDTRPEPIYIETVSKRGYRFVANVTVRHADTDPVSTRRQRSPGPWIQPAAAAMVLMAVIAGVAFRLRQPGEARPTGHGAAAHSQITFTGTATGPAISQDGQRIVYIAADGPEKRAFVRDLAGGDPVEIFRAPELGNVRWSPDDRGLLIWARGAGKAGIYLVSPHGGMPRRVADARFLSCWSPDGSLIAVPHYMGGEISLRDVQGVEQRRLNLAGTHWSIWDVDWSDANGRLALVSNDHAGRYRIWTIQPNGTGQRKVLEEIGEITTVRWSADGTALYYSHRQQETVTIKRVVVPPAGDGVEPPTAVLTGLEAGRGFSISADGTRALYARAPFHSNLWILDLEHHSETGQPFARPLTNGTSYIERPRISPDGTRVVFNVGHEPRTRIYTMPLAGGEWTTLIDLESANIGAVWSPDGAEVAFASTAGQQPQVWTVAATGGIPRRRSRSVVSDSFDLSWSRDGIAFQTPGNRNYTILDPDTGHERPLVDEDAGRWIFSPVANSEGHVAVFWTGRRRGVWVIDPARRHGRLVYATDAGSAYPVGWSAANDAVFVVEGRPAELRELASRLGETMKQASLVKVPLTGGAPQVVARIPFGEIGAVAMTPDARRLVVPVFSSGSDIWLVDGFDRPGPDALAPKAPRAPEAR